MKATTETVPGRPLGRQLLLELYGCPYEILNDLEHARRSLLEAARRGNATIVADVFHRFNPHGISGVVVIAESHIAIHSWPEHRCASVDIFSCSDKMNMETIEQVLRDAFQAERCSRTEVLRGNIAISRG
jgi:S-adenosylmethionine decarboxylase